MTTTTTDENRVDSPINKVENDLGLISSTRYNSSSERNNFLLFANRHNPAEMDAVVECANQLVDETIMRAVEKIAIDFPSRQSIETPAAAAAAAAAARVDDDRPMSANMTATTGLKFIKRMMKIWKLEPALRGWKYYAEFIGLESDESVEFYNYQVGWSYPTFAYPEPQIIVNVYFTLEANKLIDNPNDPVDVKYVFEGNRFVHPSSIKFRPKWIYDVLDIKTIIFKSLKF